MTDKVIAAIIGATVAIIGIILRDYFLKRGEEKRKAKKITLEIFRKYADPLVNISTQIVWRLDEILNQEGRGSYLLTDRFATKFAEYKRTSTSYRIAALLGWINAFRRELSFLRTDDTEQLIKIKEAISEVEKGLADGKHVENKRLDAILDLWKTSFEKEYKNKEKVAAILDHDIKEFVRKEGLLSANELSEDKQVELCEMVAKSLCDQFNVKPLNEGLINETRERAITNLSIREAWFYREWQNGLGDIMIREIDKGSRMYEVMSYYEFENLKDNGTPLQKKYIDRLEVITHNLDSSGSDKLDMRLNQLRSVLQATSKLLLSLVHEDEQYKLLLTNTIKLSKKILEQNEKST